MPGSNTLIPTVLVYDQENDRAYWSTLSQFSRESGVNPLVMLVDESDVAYSFLAKLAGPRPEKYTTEVPQGDSDE